MILPPSWRRFMQCPGGRDPCRAERGAPRVAGRGGPFVPRHRQSLQPIERGGEAVSHVVESGERNHGDMTVERPVEVATLRLQCDRPGEIALAFPQLSMTAEPCVGLPTAVTVSESPSRSESLPRTSTSVRSSSATVAVSLTATGGSLTGNTVSETVATFESTVPSCALKVKLSEPL